MLGAWSIIRQGVLAATAAVAACAPPASGALLTWPPPACGDAIHGCVDLYLSNTGTNQTPSLSAANDYRIHLPSDPLQGGLQIRGGRNVIIIGGQIDLTVPCSDSSSACHGINIEKPTSGEVFIEGVWIHDPQSPITQSTGDGIDVGDPVNSPSDIVLENVRIDGISGCSGGPDHADVFQPYSVPRARIHVDHLTGTTNCQGMTLDPDLAWDSFGEFAAEYVIKNVNINVLENPFNGPGNRYAWWLTGGTSPKDACLSGPIALRNVYARQPDGTLQKNSVWPDTDRPQECPSVWSPPTLSFPHSTQISGVVTAGTPPGGDYVPAGVAGIPYVSPGYLDSPSTPPVSVAQTVGASVPATLALTIDASASFGAFAPGVDATYTTHTTADVVSSAGDAALSVSDPGHLANGAFTLADPLQVLFSKRTWSAPVSHDPVTITFTQHIGANQPLRTGTYTKTLTFTLSTTSP
jgi:hypothetical protein